MQAECTKWLNSQVSSVRYVRLGAYENNILQFKSLTLRIWIGKEQYNHTQKML